MELRLERLLLVPVEKAQYIKESDVAGIPVMFVRGNQKTKIGEVYMTVRGRDGVLGDLLLKLDLLPEIIEAEDGKLIVKSILVKAA